MLYKQSALNANINAFTEALWQAAQSKNATYAFYLPVTLAHLLITTQRGWVGMYVIPLLFSLRLQGVTQWTFAENVDQDQTAQNVQSDLGSTLSDK